MQKHIRQRDLMGLIEQLTTLLLTGCANDTQLQAMFNYILRSGDESRFNEFMQEMAQRIPQYGITYSANYAGAGNRSRNGTTSDGAY